MIEEITYDHSRRSKHTFKCRAMKEFVQRFWNDGVWCDPFFGESPFRVDLKNDILESGIDSHDWIKSIQPQLCDGVIYDPPYSLTKCARLYKLVGIPNWQGLTRNRSGEFPALKDEISRIVRPGGQVLSFGWSSVAMGSGRGFKKTHIKLVCHGGGSRDTICVREVKGLDG